MRDDKLLKEYMEDHMKFHLKVGRDDSFRYQNAELKEDFQFSLFLSCISTIKTDWPVMFELGVSDWPTYSMVFNDIFHNQCTNICVEARKSLLDISKNRFSNGIFIHSYAGSPKHSQEARPPEVDLLGIQNKTIKSIMEEHSINHIDILHIDIQGSEVSLLTELKNDDLLKSVDNFFVSLHPEAGDMHSMCRNILDTIEGINYVYSHPSQGGYGDGLIFAKII